MKFKPGNVFSKVRGGAGSNPLNIALYIGLAIFVALALANFLLSATTANRAQENITEASELRVVSQQIAKNALRQQGKQRNSCHTQLEAQLARL